MMAYAIFVLLLLSSLANVSNDVRWSIDLRWQSPHENWGFYDIAEGILFRTARDGDVTPDWDKFLSVDRKEVWQKKYFKQVRFHFGDNLMQQKSAFDLNC